MDEYETMTMGEWFDFVLTSDESQKRIDDIIIEALTE